MIQSSITPIIQPQELASAAAAQGFVLIDARAGAQERYMTSHLAGALHVDLERDLSDIGPDPAHGGRHPLPNMIQFSRVLAQLGISPDSHVVVYDDKNAANAAARFWWMLKSIGHQKVQVLNGGLEAAIRANFPLSADIETPAPTSAYPLSEWILPLSDINEVAAATQDPKSVIIDVRDAYRFNGESEPIDLIAGHIPAAINIPFSNNLDTNGLFKSPSELRDMYSNLLNDRQADQVIVHCGSGVTACHTLLAMDYAGLEIPHLYIGSWSEWSRNDRPMVVRES